MNADSVLDWMLDASRLRAALDETKPTTLERAALNHLLGMQKDTLYRWEDFAEEQGVDFGFVVDAVMRLIRKGVVKRHVIHNKAGKPIGVRMEINYDFDPRNV